MFTNLSYFFLIILSIFLIDDKNVHCELFTSTADMENMLQVEGNLLTHFGAHILKQQNKLNYFEKTYNELFINQMKENDNGNRSDLANFSFLKRFVCYSGEWKLLPYLATYDHDLNLFKSRVMRLKNTTKYPTEEDLKGTVNGLTRLQETYQLKTSDLANGQIKDIQSTHLTANDCYLLGFYSLQNKDYYYSSLWFHSALDRLPTNHSDINLKLNILRGLVNLYRRQKNYKSAQEINNKILEIIPDDELTIIDKFWIEDELLSGKHSAISKVKNDEPILNWDAIDRFPNMMSSAAEKTLYKAVCRGDVTKSVKVLSTFHCKYESNKTPFLKIAPLKFEEVSLDPYIIVYHDVIYDSEIETIKKLASPELERAEVGEPPYTITDQRISKVAFLEEYADDCLSKVAERVRDMTGLSMKSAEVLQIVNYGIGGFYNLHYDYATPGDLAFDEMGTGNRIATLMFYMSDVKLGGATAFPLIKTAVFPKKGTAILWWNLHKTGERDHRTKHAGCPVLVGSKWVANQWMHEHEQEFRRPCSIYPDHDLEKSYVELEELMKLI